MPVLVAHRIEDPRQRHHLDPGQPVGFGAAAALLRAVPNLQLIITNARGLFHSDFVRDPGLRDKAWYVDLSLAEVDYQLHRHPADRRDLGRALAYVGPAHLLFGTHLPFSYGAPALVKLETLELSRRIGPVYAFGPRPGSLRCRSLEAEGRMQSGGPANSLRYVTLAQARRQRNTRKNMGLSQKCVWDSPFCPAAPPGGCSRPPEEGS